VEIKAAGAPPNVIVGDDPRQRDRDWATIINSLPPEPSTPTIEIFLSRQAGRYNGMIFPALGGKRYATPKGNFRVNFKSKDHYSRKYDSPMPYSLFFTAQCAIHEGSLYLYSHGCIHVNQPTAQMLFDAAVAGRTPVVVRN
jgi:lipoprotein-anchoring transpeptidase ErfK/SrfK